MVKKQKILIIITMIIFLFSVFQIGLSFGSTEILSLTNVEITDKSSTVQVDSMTYENKTITNNITFHKVGDTVTYKITVKNNENKKIILKSISDNNTNPYITFEYNNYQETVFSANEEKTFNIKAKYSNELNDISKREQSFLVEFSFNIEDEEGNKSKEDISISSKKETSKEKSFETTENTSSTNPKTGDNILIYIVLAITSFIMIIILLIKNKKRPKPTINTTLFSVIIITALLLPTISKASVVNLNISLQNSFKLHDKIIITSEINGEIIQKVINYGETMPEPEEPNIPGYEFKGWYLDDGTKYDFNTPLVEDISVNPKFDIITYNITYNLEGGEANNPLTYTVEDEIVLNSPSKEGYTFTGWTGTDLIEKTEHVTIPKGSIDDRHYEACYELTSYPITYELNGGIVNNPNTYTIEDEITLNNPNKEGYTFAGWTGTNYDIETDNAKIERGSKGERTYIAHYNAINYTITYNGVTEEEKTALNNPTTYTIESENILLHNPSDRTDIDGDITEKFIGWKENNTTSIDTTITTGTTGNKTYTAIWQAVDPEIYTITYSLNGGELENENVTSFTKNTENFTLNNPTKKGYEFKGWTGSNGNVPQKTVVIEKGTRTNLNYTANFEIIKYTIIYNLDGGTATNDESYDVETDNITLNIPTKEGYKFIGWSGTDLTGNENETVIIPKGSIGDREYTAHYTPNVYTIIFDSNTGIGNMANQDIEYNEEVNLKANAFTKTGYTFKKWNTEANGTGDSYNDEQEVINLATNGTVTLYAQWEENIYKVSFNANCELETEMEDQDFTYNERKTLTQNSFIREGYTFLNWNTESDGTGNSYNDQQEVVNLVTNGTVTLYAQWKINTYYIKFNSNGGSGQQMEQQSFSYNEEKELESNTYTNEGYYFAGWNTEPDGNGTYYAEMQTVKNLTNVNEQTIILYASWRQLKVGDYINYNPASGDGENLKIKTSEVPNGVTLSDEIHSEDITKWRVYNVTDNEVTLVAEKPSTQTISLTGIDGYKSGVKFIDGVAEIFGHGIGATEGRNIKLEDIEPYFKYDKTTFRNPNSSTGYYGGTRSYTTGQHIINGNIVTASSTAPITLTHTTYWYDITNNNIYSQQENETANKIYNMLCVDIPVTNLNNNNTNYTPYWITNEGNYLNSESCMYSIHYMGDMHYTGTAEKGVKGLYSSSGTGSYTHECHVLPIVKLNTYTKYTFNQNNESWDMSYTPVNYTVSFNSNGGTGTMPEETFESGIKKKLFKNTFENTGYVFNGWNTQADGRGTYYSNTQEVKDLTTENGANIELYAMWIDLKVGDYINYDSSSGDGLNLKYTSSNLPEGISISNTFGTSGMSRWRVFNISNGEIEIIPSMTSAETVTLTSWSGITKGVETLDNICDIYGHGVGAKEGRSIKLRDIEPHFKFDKTTFKSRFSDSSGYYSHYGEEKEYTTGTYYIDGELVNASETNPKVIRQTAYWFNLAENAYSEQENATSNMIYNMLCVNIPISNGENDNNYTPYWIADSCVRLEHDCAQYYIHYMGDLHGRGIPEMGGQWLTTSIGANGTATLHVLPVVKMDISNIYKFNDNENIWNINR